MGRLIGETEIAYLAGVFDGEGTVKVGNSIRVSVEMTDLDVLERFQRAFGGQIYPRKAKVNRKPAWSWNLQSRAGVWPFLDKVKPFLSDRRQAKIEELSSVRPS